MDSRPVIYNIPDNEKALEDFELRILKDNTTKKDLLLRYPTVYIHNCIDNDKYDVYVGESNNIIQRTKEHFENARSHGTWQSKLLHEPKANLFIIGHPHFNKSLTLDVENRLMHYLLGAESVRTIYNARGNAQDEYYTSEEFDSIFNSIWEDLRKKNKHLFPSQGEVEDSAIFRASPFHKLTQDQLRDKEAILDIIEDALRSGKRGQIVFVSGEAGTGKTVLNSTMFYELCMAEKTDGTHYNVHMIVNHDEQLKVYQDIAEKLQLQGTEKVFVSKPTTFINHHDKDNPVDVIFVDEAHLLWSQGKQSYRGKNMIEDLQTLSRVLVLMFDEHQMLHTQEYWDPNYIERLKEEAKRQNRLKNYYFELKNQLRIHGNKSTVKWIQNITRHLLIGNIPKDKKYEIRIFESPADLEEAIRKKAVKKETQLSRIIATFDWKYVNAKKPKDADFWYVSIGDWKMPWNNQKRPANSKKYKNLSWAEKDYTIDEVGSTFTIQGFDLNYAGVILGPSVIFRDGKIQIDANKSQDAKAKNNRTLKNGEKRNFAEKFIRNEINVLLTRGVDGLFIYAVDDELRKQLKKAEKGEII